LRTSFSELLPDNKASVVEMRRLKSRLAQDTTLTVVGQGQDTEALKRFVDALSPRIRALGPDKVVSVEDGTRELRAFFTDHKHLYADLEDIEQLHADVIERYNYEVGKKTGAVFDLDDPPPPITAESLEERFSKKTKAAEKKAKGVDGYYIGEDGTFAVILVRTPFGTGDERGLALRKEIEGVIAELTPSAIDPAIEIGFTGNLITGAELHQTIKSDLVHVGVWGVSLILVVVLLFFMRLRTLLAMGITIAVGCVWAFGAANFTVGHLNSATGFLVSIIAGNGINFGIIYMARYGEARRDGASATEGIRIAHRDTYAATLAAAAAAAIAYGSLSVTDFRGFKHFGLIGGVGMGLCWLATYWLLPACLVLMERVKPWASDGERSWTDRVAGAYGKPFAWLSSRAPRLVTVLGVVSGIGACWLTYGYFAEDPLETNLRTINNKPKDKSDSVKLSLRVDKIVGRSGQGGKAIVVDRLDQVKPLLDELERRRTSAPPDAIPFERTISVFDLLPTDQERKLELLEEIDDRLRRAKRRGFMSEEQWEDLQPHIPKTLEPIGIEELPEQVARPFMERDGTRGRVVYLVPKKGRSVYDATYVDIFAASFREVKLPNGEVIRGSGDPVIFSDMFQSVREDAPKAVAVSLLGTFLVLVIAFRAGAAAWLSLSALGLGIAWLVAILALAGIKLNFLNFVALPISIGVGSDYVVNVMKRRQLEGGEDFRRLMVETGGAVVLCSLTTTVGYLSLLLSINGAVSSFGLAAALGEVTTLLAAMLVLPAALFWLAQSRSK
ncbi:MAG: MMPL family transporter, partial [Polyangiaceae bacterium]